MKKKIIGFCIILFSILWGINFSYAEEKVSDPLHGITKADPSNWSLDQPVWKSGKIDSITNENLIISDTEYYFSTNIKFYSEDGNLISKKRFKRGKKVKFVLSSGKRWVVTKLILMD